MDEKLRYWLWWAVVAVGVVLLATGVWLSFFYRPTSPDGGGEQLMRVVHRTSSALLVPLVLAAAIMHVVVRRRSWPAAVGVVMLTFVLAVTGYLLPWDQVALYAVTVGTNVRGLWYAAFDNGVKFVIVGNTEISRGTLRSWFVVHAAVLPVLLAVCVAALRRRSSTVEATGA